jgi:hypothetical protein
MVTETHRDWNWETDGEFEGHYVETREVTIKTGPSAGQTKLVFDFHAGLDDESVSIFETAVLRSKLAKELKTRRKPDFEPGELLTITPSGWKDSANGRYRDFDVTFEHAAPKPTAAELLDPSREEERPTFEADNETPW